tara:strand:- start:2510 stop:3757 length:1248 start_codon:yes stop_codon:yes gene_type:complete
MAVYNHTNTLHSGLTGVDRVNPTNAVNVDATSSNLWMPVWAGEVLNAYDQYISFEPHVTHRTIANGMSIKFPLTGTVGLKPQWGAGEELAGGGGPSTSITVSLDDRPMAAHFELDNPDLMVTQWEYRSEMARQTGMTLANTSDKQIASLIAQAACQIDANFALIKKGVRRPDADGADTDGDGGPLDSGDYTGGQVYTGDGIGTGNGGDGGSTGTTRNFDYNNLGLSSAAAEDRTDAALGLLEDIENFFVHLQEINAPTEGVVCCVSPQAFADIRSLNIAREAGDFSNGGGHPFFGGSATDMGNLGAPLTVGMHGMNDTLMYQGAVIMKSNHANFKTDYTDSNLQTTAIGDKKYGCKFSKLCALIWQPEAVARLTLQGMKTDSVEDVRRNTHFTVASTYKGGGTLRPECAGVMLKN